MQSSSQRKQPRALKGRFAKPKNYAGCITSRGDDRRIEKPTAAAYSQPFLPTNKKNEIYIKMRTKGWGKTVTQVELGEAGQKYR